MGIGSALMESSMIDVLNDCPFAKAILSLPQPEQLLIFGSGQSRMAPEWAHTPAIVFNSLHDRPLPVDNVYAVVANRTKQGKRLYNKLRRDKKPVYLFRFHQFLSAQDSINLLESRLWARFGVLPSLENLGAWFFKAHKRITELAGKSYYFSTGFYACCWLLGGSSKEIFMAGFDGWTQKAIKNIAHPIHLEWQFIEEAICVARGRGTKVLISKEISA